MFALMAALALFGGNGGFFDGEPVRFWTPSGPAEPDLWADSDAPAPVLRLLEAPTPANAQAYLEWQKGRLRSLQAAMAAVEQAGEGGEILSFSRPGCGYCLLQDRELEGLPVRRVAPGSPLWEEHRVTVTPTLVVRGRTFRGLTPRARILEALNRD